MADQPFYSPDRKPAPARQRTPGELLWTLVKGGHVYHAELRAREPWGCELQIYLDDDLRIGHLHANRLFAETEATIRRQTLIEKGWQAADHGSR